MPSEMNVKKKKKKLTGFIRLSTSKQSFLIIHPSTKDQVNSIKKS